jgi:hypothetical protein
MMSAARDQLDDLCKYLADVKGKGIVRMNALEDTAEAAGRLKDDHDINDNIRMAGLKSACVENGLYSLESNDCIEGKIRIGLKKGRSKQTQNGHDNRPSPSVLETKSASSFTLRGIRRLWPDRFALGKLGLIGGLPDKGKGLISCDLIACVTNNQPLPCNEGTTPQGNVIYFSAEDDNEDTLVPRLKAAHADLDRVHIAQMMGDADGKKRTFSMVTDLEALRAKIDEIGNVVLVIIDPMTSYLGIGKVNNSMTTDVRGFLKPLTDLAAEKAVSIIGIMHFNKKADVTNAMLRIADSLAYVAAARHVYVVVDDTEVDKRRLFVKAKNNLAPDTKALSYMTGLRKVGIDEETKKEIFAPYVLWGGRARRDHRQPSHGGRSRGQPRQNRATGGKGIPARPSRRWPSQERGPRGRRRSHGHFQGNPSPRKKGSRHHFQKGNRHR